MREDMPHLPSPRRPMVRPAPDLLSCASRLSGLYASLRPSARPRVRFGLARAPHEPPTSISPSRRMSAKRMLWQGCGYRRGSIPPRPLSPRPLFTQGKMESAAKVPRFIDLSPSSASQPKQRISPNEVSSHRRALCGVQICRALRKPGVGGWCGRSGACRCGRTGLRM